MAEEDLDHHNSPEHEDQINDNNRKKKHRKRKRSRKSEQEVEIEQENNETAESEEEKNDELQHEEEHGDDFEEEENKVETAVSSGIMSTETFSSLGLSQPTSKSITDMSFTRMTQVTHFLFIY